MIRSFGPYFIVKKTDFPAFQKAHRLSRSMTEVQLEDILEHRYHLHRNPSRKLRVITSDKCQAETEEIA
jgi:hypothetical protein